MVSYDQILYKLIRYSARIYSKIQRSFPSILPANPLLTTNSKSSLITKSLMNVKTHAHMDGFEPLIKNELNFFLENQKELESIQTVKEVGNILKLVKNTESIPGDILELGIAKGGTTITIAHFLKNIKSNRNIFGCDSFEGLPYEDKFSDKASEKVSGMYCNSFEVVSNNVKKFKTDDKITLIKGLFEDTLYEKLNDKKFSFVFLDCDLYDATKYCLEFVWPRLSQNGIIVFDDYGGGARDLKKGKWGETKAVDEFCTEKEIKIQLDPEPMIIKK